MGQERFKSIQNCGCQSCLGSILPTTPFLIDGLTFRGDSIQDGFKVEADSSD